jgi:hypothetical protein
MESAYPYVDGNAGCAQLGLNIQVGEVEYLVPIAFGLGGIAWLLAFSRSRKEQSIWVNHLRYQIGGSG